MKDLIDYKFQVIIHSEPALESDCLVYEANAILNGDLDEMLKFFDKILTNF